MATFHRKLAIATCLSVITFSLTNILSCSATSHEPQEKNKPALNSKDIRVLASQCYQCHGTHGISVTKWDSIAGEDIEEVFEVKHPLMKAQRQGYTRQELIEIMKYLQQFGSHKKHEEHEEYEKHEEHHEENDD